MNPGRITLVLQRWSRSGGEVSGLGVQCPLPSSYPRTTSAISWLRYSGLLPSLLGHRARPPPPRAMEPCRPSGYFKVNPVPYSIIALVFPRGVLARKIWLGLEFRATQKWALRPEIAPGQPGKITQDLEGLSSWVGVGYSLNYQLRRL